MRKITLFGAMLITASSLFSQSQFKWNGSQPVQEWDYATANWLDPNFAIPIPKTFIDGADAIFDDSSLEGSDTIKVNGTINVDSIKINATKTYVIRRTADTDGLTGNGALIKDGEGTFVMDVKNSLLGGTVIRNGKLMMEKQTTPNIFGTKIRFEGGIANFATTTSGSYPSVSVPIEIATGATAKVELSRYSFFASPITGSGDLEMATGGERTLLGTNKAGGVTVDWSDFTGNVIISAYKMAGVTPGYYGLLIPTTKTFDYEDFNTVDSLFHNKTVSLKSDAGLTGCSGVRCWSIGELQGEDEGSFLAGYGSGNSNSPRVYWMVGAKNTDVVFPGTLRDAGSQGYNYFGLYKVGTGTYTFTSTKSITTAFTGVQIKEGSFYVNTPIEDGITSLGRVRTGNVMTIGANTFGGGNGRLTGKVQVNDLGTLVVGYNNVGMLALSDTLGGNSTASPLVVENGGKIIFKLATTESYDKITSNSTATLNGSTIVLKPASGLSISDGDTFTILSARVAVTAPDSFVVEAQGFPETITFTAATDTIGGGFRIIVSAHGSTNLKQVNEKLVSVFPNPSNGIVNFTSDNSEITSIEIINLQGQSILKRSIGSTTANLNLENLQSGIYYAKVITTKGTNIHKLMIK
jgi:hypothetical protein